MERVTNAMNIIWCTNSWRTNARFVIVMPHYYINFVLRSCLIIVIMCVSPVGYLLAVEPAHVLKQLREALASANSHYGKPEREGRGFSGHKHLPEEVIKYIYWRNKEEGDPIRIDYYTVPTIFNLFTERFLAREIFLYDHNSDIRYLVWTNEKNEIQWFTKKIPSKRISYDKKAGTEVKKVEFIHYDKNGVMTKRDEWVDFVNHRNKTATYIATEYNAQGEILSKQSGDEVYGDVAGEP